ncbi:MAG: PEP-CTERM sorting domain-containing protein [Planctomycetota bacterium]|jgi:hypothetical protein
MERIALTVIVCVLAMHSSAMPVTIDIKDGQSHTINDNTYQETDTHLRLDYGLINTPGTHVDLVNGGTVGGSIQAYNDASLNMSGGFVGGGVHALDTTNITISDGHIWYNVSAYHNSNITITGGTAGNQINGGSVLAHQNSIITISGGTFNESLFATTNSTIYLEGTGFQVDGHELSYGDALRDFGNENGFYLSGFITGTLADGISQLNNPFNIEAESTANIIIIPEPSTLLLLGFGGLALLRKRR